MLGTEDMKLIRPDSRLKGSFSNLRTKWRSVKKLAFSSLAGMKNKVPQNELFQITIGSISFHIFIFLQVI